MKEDFKLHNKSFNFYTFIHNFLVKDNNKHDLYIEICKHFPSNEYSQICDSYEKLFKNL